MLKADLSEVIAVSSDGNFPFDLRFKSRNRLDYDDEDPNSVTAGQYYVGPGVYVVFFHGKPLTTGILKTPTTSHSNILEARWLRLLNRVTLRGIQTGFGIKASDSQIKRKKIQKLAATLPETLRPYIEQLAMFELDSRNFADTGAVVTAADLDFACEHWESAFEHATEATILQPFEFVYFQLLPSVGSLSNKNVDQLLKDVEKALTQKYRFLLLRNSGESGELSDSNIDEVERFITSLVAGRCSVRMALHLT